MAQNYSHGKRQRELAKKQKREEKRERKLARQSAPGAPDTIDPSAVPPGEAPANEEKSGSGS